MRYKSCSHRVSRFLMLASMAFLAGSAAQAQTQFVINGGFESGDLTGWQVSQIRTGSFLIDDNALDPLLSPPAPATPDTGLPTVGAASGNFYAVSDSLGEGAQALHQTFTIPAGALRVTLSFQMFVNDWNGAGALNTGAAPFAAVSATPTQFARVDLMTSGADVFANTGVLQNFYLGVDNGADPGPPNAYASYSFDLTPQVGGGGTFLLRFVTAANQFTMNQGIDNVSITANTALAAPEPGALCLYAAGICLLSISRRKQK